MTEQEIKKMLDLFNLPNTFTEDELHQAYRDLAQVWHPDKHTKNPRLQKKAEAKLKEINNHYTYLKKLIVDGESSIEAKQNSSEESQETNQNDKHESKTIKKRTLKKSQFYIFSFLIIIGILFFTNKSGDEIESEIYNRLKSAVRELPTDVETKRAFLKITRRVVDWVDVENYYIFSIINLGTVEYDELEIDWHPSFSINYVKIGYSICGIVKYDYKLILNEIRKG